MGQLTIYFDMEEDLKIEQHSLLWNIAKYETVKRMVREFKEEK